MAGQHKIQYDEGDVYEGEWSADGKRHGQGVLTFASGARYVGRFVNGFFQVWKHMKQSISYSCLVVMIGRFQRLESSKLW